MTWILLTVNVLPRLSVIIDMKLAFFLCATLAAYPQTPQFEVASVKVSQSNSTGSYIRNNPGRFETQNTTLHRLIQYALPAQDFQVVGGPGWIRDARFDINAATGQSDSDVQSQAERIARIRARLMQFLEDRFQLQLRQEERDMPVYALTVEKSGPRMKPADPIGNVNLNGGAAGSTMNGKGMTMARLAEVLSGIANRPVNDETGLTGAYDLDLHYTLDLDTPDAAAPPKDPSAYPSLFTAMKEQLGLRLTARKGSAPVWVVVRAEKPGEN